ncbi:MAG: M23 family metallopeptidase [Rhodocyclaceae bacterium]|nr:M23 family metallopeptidase [Rhodocyclaceae bacterium]
MQIILVSRHLKAAKTIAIMPRHLAMVLATFLAAVFLTSAAMSWLSVHLRFPVVEEALASMQNEESQKTQEYVANNIQMMAARLGELQAQVLQLDTLGDRLAGMAGIKRASVVKEIPAGGGPFLPAPMTANELQAEIERMAQTVESKNDELVVLESKFLEQRVKERLLPTTLPVKDALLGSLFGIRTDPIAGVRAMHEGIDFRADQGTPVVVAADGVVLAASYHREYGNLVEVDHGGSLVSRYAHLSRLNVKPGQIVKRGDLIGDVGSTGRSTGSHLHFEVRMFGVAQNPAHFLRKGSEFALLKRQ